MSKVKGFSCSLNLFTFPRSKQIEYVYCKEVEILVICKTKNFSLTTLWSTEQELQSLNSNNCTSRFIVNNCHIREGEQDRTGE